MEDMLNLSNEQMEKFRKLLTPQGTEHLRCIRDSYGDGYKLSVMIPTKTKKIPHHVHFREGIAIRNFLREVTDCAWTDYEYDDNWERVTLEAIK